MSAKQLLSIEQLQLLPEDELVDSIRSRPEDQWFDRTSSRATARQVGDILVSFANAEGGWLAIGVYEGHVEATAAPGRVNDWKQAAVDFTVPPVRHRFRLIPCADAGGRPTQIVLIEVEPSEHVHENVRGETLLRIGDENRKLSPLQAMELRFDKGEAVFDGTPVRDASEADLSQELVKTYVDRIRGNYRRGIALQARGLLTTRDSQPVPTVAGIMVVGSAPQRFYPEAYVRLLRYRGSSRETGIRANVMQDVIIDGPISSQIEGARRRLRRWIPRSIRLGDTGRFAGSTLIPESAWLEAIVNAVVHRSYSIAGDHVRVEVFEDRLEVESPGRLPGLVRIENIRSTRFARNPRIARAIADLGYGRELGEGINRMFEEMQRAGLPDPIYAQGAASVRVTFLADTLSGQILEALPPGLGRFVEFLSRTGRVTTTQAVSLMRVSRPTSLSHLHRLAALDLIEHVGTSLKDPRGFWRLRRGPEARGS